MAVVYSEYPSESILEDLNPEIVIGVVPNLGFPLLEEKMSFIIAYEYFKSTRKADEFSNWIQKKRYTIEYLKRINSIANVCPIIYKKINTKFNFDPITFSLLSEEDIKKIAREDGTVNIDSREGLTYQVKRCVQLRNAGIQYVVLEEANEKLITTIKKFMKVGIYYDENLLHLADFVIVKSSEELKKAVNVVKKNQTVLVKVNYKDPIVFKKKLIDFTIRFFEMQRKTGKRIKVIYPLRKELLKTVKCLCYQERNLKLFALCYSTIL